MKHPRFRLALAAALLASLTSAARPATASFYYPTGNAPYCRGKAKGMPPFATWKSVALSPDLLRRYPCGSTVYVTFVRPFYGKRTVTLTVQDRTAARFTNRVDILIGRNEDALRYGLRAVTLSKEARR